jgi:hypothetical protein
MERGSSQMSCGERCAVVLVSYGVLSRPCIVACCSLGVFRPSISDVMFGG